MALTNNALAGKYDAEVRHLKEYTDAYVDQVIKNIESFYGMKAIYDRTIRAMDRTLEVKKTVVQSCKQFWNQKEPLVNCIAQQRFSLEQLHDAIEYTKEVFDGLKPDIEKTFAINGFDPSGTIKKFELYKKLILGFEQNYYTPLVERNKEATKRFIHLYGEAALNKYQSKFRPYKDDYQATQLESEIRVAARVMLEDVEKAITEQRFIRASYKLNGMTWLSKHFDSMLETLAPAYQKSSNYRAIYNSAKAVFAKSLEAANIAVKQAEARRPNMVENRLAMVRKEVLSTRLAHKDREQMLSMIDYAGQSFKQYKSTKKPADLRRADVLIEQVSTWLNGEQ